MFNINFNYTIALDGLAITLIILSTFLIFYVFLLKTTDLFLHRFLLVIRGLLVMLSLEIYFWDEPFMGFFGWLGFRRAKPTESYMTVNRQSTEKPHAIFQKMKSNFFETNRKKITTRYQIHPYHIVDPSLGQY